ncbi:hypothetical protein [Nonomuraea dietziae]|uniref:Uncharacterized protein n=1 Tax=Nonomuraea dietziae TaxID=65515 RepID=A0A7W5VAG7_9ACTN|nr:hypothetical protein [Nonomuraea dietziae]MBB3730070.1 hypothetical protein [Nonomuraea dietziae]
MLTVLALAIVISLACLAVPVSIWVRMLVTRRRTVAEIRSTMAAHRRTCCTHLVNTNREVTS